MPSSGDATPTWTWLPQVSTSCTVGPNCSSIRRYRGFGVMRPSPGNGEVPSAADPAPASRAATETVCRQPFSSCSTSARSVPTDDWVSTM